MFDLLHHYHRKECGVSIATKTCCIEPAQAGRLAEWIYSNEANPIQSHPLSSFVLRRTPVWDEVKGPFAENNKDDHSNQPSHPNRSRSLKFLARAPRLKIDHEIQKGHLDNPVQPAMSDGFSR